MPFVICVMLQKKTPSIYFIIFYFHFTHAIVFLLYYIFGFLLPTFIFNVFISHSLLLAAVVDLAVVTFVFILFVSSILMRLVGGKASELLWDHYSLTCTKVRQRENRE